MPAGALLSSSSSEAPSAHARVSGEQEWKAALAAFRETQKDAMDQAKSVLDSAKTYQTTVFGLAYGGFFAIWGFSRSFIADTRLMAATGALMAFSILLFVIFEIANMTFMSRIAARKLELVAGIQEPASLKDLQISTEAFKQANFQYRQQTIASARRLQKVWHWFFWPSLGSGVLAALLLVFLLVRHSIVGAV
jgi:hypothetical protein